MTPVTLEELRPHLQAFDFPSLFVEGLGWDHYVTEPLVVHASGRDYSLAPIAEKAGFAVYACESSADNRIPEYPVRRKIESEVAKRIFEHLIIFTDPDHKAQVWQWVRRETGKPSTCREYTFTAGNSGTALLQHLQSLFISLDEESSANITLVTSRVRSAFDVERVTKRFYDRFRSELAAFGDFIEGITAQGDRDWYASLMLNRMMFIYFVQKQGFLADNTDYLRNRLHMVQAQSGDGRFQQFYRLFLLRLFHEGLGQPEAQRAPELAALLGRVPFLNGGLFDVHDLERDNPSITIPDAAFERVFDFFDGYRWHLDERPYREDNEINPDVLGYIFEKYINQKQMGAYYTKEDITGYISRNTVIPFLFDAAKQECPVAFGPDGGVWQLLRDDPDRYIYPAVSHGLTWNARDGQNPTRLNEPFELPEGITAGIADISQRGGWNAPATDDYALPAETWREVVARRQRHAEVRNKLVSGEVTDINDLITLNLDIERFARDVIAQSEGPELLRAFWHAMRDVSVLDPTCGSGAFLFAALNILEPLYTACLEGMRGFLDDLERTARPRSPQALSDFRGVLDQVDKHPSERYFILKSIVLNNLYGVDIMEEAVEICKLRLFLKLVAQLERYDQIEPLPDIDFNVRAGNTLVGFTSLDSVRQAMTVMPNGQRRQVFPEDQATLDRIVEEARGVEWMAHEFRRQQTMLGGEVSAADKQALRDRLRRLSDELDRHLAHEYGVDTERPGPYNAWRSSHHPFHWFVEFYGIMSKDGFDVVIGNPPYVQWRRLEAYTLRGYRTSRCPDVYAACVERSTRLTTASARYGMILPISFQFSGDFAEARSVVSSYAQQVWVSTFSRNPAALFSASLGVRSSILIAQASRGGTAQILTTRLNRWTEEARRLLFHSLEYGVLPESLTSFGWARTGNSRMSILFDQLIANETALGENTMVAFVEPKKLGFKTTGLYYISAFVSDPPSFDEFGTPIPHTDVGSLYCPTPEIQKALSVLAIGKIALLWWAATGDDFHVTASGLSSTPINVNLLERDVRSQLQDLSMQLQELMSKNVIYTRYAGKWMGNYDVKRVRHLTDVADRLVLESLGLGGYWEDLELEYVRFMKMTGERPGTTRSVPTFTQGVP